MPYSLQCVCSHVNICQPWAGGRFKQLRTERTANGNDEYQTHTQTRTCVHTHTHTCAHEHERGFNPIRLAPQRTQITSSHIFRSSRCSVSQCSARFLNLSQKTDRQCAPCSPIYVTISRVCVCVPSVPCPYWAGVASLDFVGCIGTNTFRTRTHKLSGYVVSLSISLFF